MTDITILTCQKYLYPAKITQYEQNILDERSLIINALEAKGLTVKCTYWDDPNYDWTQTKAVVFRTIWDYFERFGEFTEWLEKVKHQTQLINSYELIMWNIDKHYLLDLEKKSIPIVPTVYVDSENYRSMNEICEERGWTDVVIKPSIAGGAFLTYKVLQTEREDHELLFKNLVKERDMLVQPFITSIASKGEASLMVFNGVYTHAILKKAKAGDYRVQDDWGGTVHPYEPSNDEIRFAENCFKACSSLPAYGRADILWSDEGGLLLGELEIVEPELWVRNAPETAAQFAEGVVNYLS